MEVSIREATEEDYNELRALFAQGDTFHARALPHIFRDAGNPTWPASFISALSSDENGALLVAQDRNGGGLIGMLHTTIRVAPDHPSLVPRRWAEIESLIVREGYRRRGIGRLLMAGAHEWARGKGLEYVQLNVWEFNRHAIDLYAKIGYETLSRRMGKKLDY